MGETINAGIAMMKVLEDWDVQQVYGIPGGSINSTMEALRVEKEKIDYIQVRHEEVGAFAATAHAKLTGKIGVCFGSAGPGATHLFNGLYDAQMDHVPVLALIGQVGTGDMNWDSFQEMNENPMFVDVSVYNRTVMTAESLPHVVDEAIRRAYKENGVAVVTIPNDLGKQEISTDFWSSGHSYVQPLLPEPNEQLIGQALELIKQAKRPIIFAGIGVKGATEELISLSKHLKLPVVMSSISKGTIPDDFEANMGSAYRVATKPGNETLEAADLIVMIGADFPFGRTKNLFKSQVKFIQIDIDAAKIGKRHNVDVPLLSDAKKAMKQLVAQSDEITHRRFYDACVANMKNWRAYLQQLADKTTEPLEVGSVFKQINRITTGNDVFAVDVGDVTMNSLRFLNMNPNQKFTTSALFATMGYGIGAAIAGKLTYPERQVFNLAGDGAFAMVMQDVLTQVKEKLPIINVVFSNESFDFIKDEQEDEKQKFYGVDLQGADFAMIANGMGAMGISVKTHQELITAFDKAVVADGPVVIDVKIRANRPLPAEDLQLDPATEITEFKRRYEAEALQPISVYLNEFEVE
ncbi:pyruvate oxidase [Pediococcus ethanolidurans]|uniref:pyruvate oxidase n=1 Tax=Pediococcus ethanolidurans TaxID=319653 RepID=UPI0021E7A9BA|nr:pyruvate oxidase [Pediococcus ethanolidurans]MCV3316032.1 pyruvate oxidase [Pediococcus ethanolidurans]MCV3321680.1 pyruvate oxidase [Pediococcus ethanolidurans]MCV3324599.1 pyruvate oxidase [Pediococcus ethanolidurans]MCV3328286.1 pyruvate oxidase [Pediococcus ethanolidurans]